MPPKKRPSEQGRTSDCGMCEHIEFNVIGAWMGENTPLFLRRVEM